MINRIPADASVATSTCLTPHLLKQSNIQLLDLNTNTDYILLFDTDYPKQLAYLKSTRGYKIISQEGGFQLLKKS